jgi:hypothetical protein
MQKKIVMVLIVAIAIVLIAFEIWFFNRKIKRIDEKMHRFITVIENENCLHRHIAEGTIQYDSIFRNML